MRYDDRIHERAQFAVRLLVAATGNETALFGSGTTGLVDLEPWCGGG